MELSADHRFSSSDFPSLSGAPQPPQPSTNQAVWGSSNARGGTTTAPVQRPPAQSQQSNPPPPGPSPTHQPQTAESENIRPSPFAPISSAIDDFRYDDHGGTNREPRRPGGQGSTDDFPPLGGLGRADLRPGAAQTSQLAGLGTGTTYMPTQTRNGPFHADGHADVLQPLSAGGRVVSPSDMPTGSQFASIAFFCKTLTM